MQDSDNEDNIRAVPIILAALASPFLLAALWLFLAFNNKYRTCIPLKNGASLGFEAVFDLSRDFFKPIAVPKLADGTPIIREDTWALYITDTTLYGLTFADKESQGYRFAWRMDTGLVLEHINPDAYETLVAKAGNANWNLGTGSYGAGGILGTLIERPDFETKTCPTALITW